MFYFAFSNRHRQGSLWVTRKGFGNARRGTNRIDNLFSAQHPDNRTRKIASGIRGSWRLLGNRAWGQLIRRGIQNVPDNRLESKTVLNKVLCQAIQEFVTGGRIGISEIVDRLDNPLPH